MEKGRKFQLLTGIMGGWLVIFGWARSMLSSPDPLSVGSERVSFMVLLYLVVFLYASWKMFKPSWMNLPGYVEREYGTEPPYPYSLWYKKKDKS